jgi:Eukaryotic protein of unknown function (DUF829)
MSLSKLSPTVYFLPSTSKTPSADAPSAILLFAWMGAPVRHMSKFIDYYHNSLFPDSPIVLTLSTSEGFFAKPNLRAALVEPAYTTFKSLQIDPSDVLVHIFSNGGLNAFHTFVSLTPTKSFSPRMLVMDSAPGKATLAGGVKAFTIDIKSRVKRFLMAIFIGLMLCLVKLKDNLSGKGSLMDRQRAWFLDGRAIDKTTRRLFLYSDGDDLVRSELVEEVIQECEEKGYPVWSRNFGETRHVGHMRAKPEEYWNQIVQVWKE